MSVCVCVCALARARARARVCVWLYVLSLYVCIHVRLCKCCRPPLTLLTKGWPPAYSAGTGTVHFVTHVVTTVTTMVQTVQAVVTISAACNIGKRKDYEL